MTEPPESVGRDRDELLVLGGRARRQRPRQGLILTAAIGMAVGALIGMPMAGDDDRVPADHQGALRRVGVHPAVAAAAAASHMRTTLHGAPVAGTSRVQLLITDHVGWPLVWLTLGSGKPRSLELPPDAQRYEVQAFSGGVLLRPSTPRPCAACSIPRYPVFYAPTGSRRVTRVGFASWDAAITADHAAVWLTNYRRPRQPGSRRLQTLSAQKVDLSGHPLGPPATLPYGYVPAGGWLEQPVDQLLVRTWRTPDSTGNHYALWNPDGRRMTAGFGSVIAVGTHQLAWTASSCTAPCSLRLTNLTKETTRTVPVLPGHTAILGSYSPDGRHLALLVTAADGSASQAVRVGILDEPTDRLRLVPRTALDVIPTLNWSADGRWLVITGLGSGQIGLVNPNTRQLQVTTLPG